MASKGNAVAVEQLVIIDAPHFCAGVVLRDGRVIIAAPILKYMVGWYSARVIAYAAKKCWKVEMRRALWESYTIEHGVNALLAEREELLAQRQRWAARITAEGHTLECQYWRNGSRNSANDCFCCYAEARALLEAERG